LSPAIHGFTSVISLPHRRASFVLLWAHVFQPVHGFAIELFLDSRCVRDFVATWGKVMNLDRFDRA
jgi:hypothetical protein